MNTASLLQASSSRTETLSVFCDAYGTDEGQRRFCNFRAALEFLDTQKDAVTRAGLAGERKPMEVCEELVGFLLSYERRPGQGRIPRGALVRFLDEWGHRWI